MSRVSANPVRADNRPMLAPAPASPPWPHASARRAQWTETELVRRMLAREDAAWREFIERYGRLVRSQIHRVTGRFSSTLGREDGEEIFAAFLHGLLLRDMHKLRSFDSERGSSLATWIGMLAMNAAWDHLRTVARHARGASELARHEAVACTSNPLLSLVAQESSRRMRLVVSQLSNKDRTFVRLFYELGKSPEEISVAMNISIKTVYSKKHKINARLQSCVH